MLPPALPLNLRELSRSVLKPKPQLLSMPMLKPRKLLMLRPKKKPRPRD